MRLRGREAVLAAALALLISCHHDAPVPPSTVRTPLPEGVVARVGDEAIPASLVAAVAAAQGIGPRAALDRLIDDALAASGARASGDDRIPRVHWALESILGRASVEHVRLDAQAAGPPTDEELEQVTQIHWLDVDLPEQVRVIHAVVRRPKDPAQNPAARALAARLLAAATGASDAADFKARIAAVPTGPLEVTVEELPPFVADGRIADPHPSALDPTFAAAAFALKKPGDTSAIVESPYGWHVIRLLERLPAKILPAAERRAQFAEEVLAHRGRVALDALLDRRRASSPIAIRPDAEARMAEQWSRRAP